MGGKGTNMIMTIVKPLILSLSFGQVIDMRDVEIKAAAPMECVVKIKAASQALEARVVLGVVNADFWADSGVCIENISNSFIEIVAVRAAKYNGVVVWQQDHAKYGIFNNSIKIGSIRHNGQNGLLILSPEVGMLGVQGNHFEVGQMIDNKHSGMAVFGYHSAWNQFSIGASEWNGFFGIYDAGRENIFVVRNTNSNGYGGMIQGENDLVSGFFSDGRW